MYSEQDMKQVDAMLRREWLALGPALAIIAGAYIYALAARVRWLLFVAGGLLFVVLCYGILARLLPLLRYRGFLRDMDSGLSREMRVAILEISEKPELQDGAMVLPVRVRLEQDGTGAKPVPRESLAAERLSKQTMEDTRDERILYLNASKREQFPGPGATVTLRCFGRHIRAVEADG